MSLPYLIDSFRGGLSGENDKGIAGSFKFGRCLDIHKKEDTLSCNQSLKKESGAIVVDLILWLIPASDGNTYGFGDAGKIYKRTSAGAWSVVHDVGAKITGAEEWNGYIYYTHGVNLGRKAFPGLSNWTDAVDAWKTDLENSEWHTMKMATGNLLICNSEYLAMVAYYGSEGKASEGTSTTLKDDNKAWGTNDWQNQKVRITAGTGKGQERTITSNTSDTLTVPAWDTVPDTTSEYVITSVDVGIYNNTALELRPGNKTKCLLDRDDYVVIGSEMTDESEKGYLWTWTTEALKWIKKKLIPAKGINCLIDTDIMICQAGDNGEIFFSDLVNKKPIGNFYGGGQVKPGGVCNKGGLAMFAVYGNDECGIYSYGRKKMNRPFTLNLSYIPSCGQSSSKVLGAMTMAGDDLLLSWKDGATYGCDVIDSANKVDGIYEGLEFDGGQDFAEKLFDILKITMRPLPTGCSIKVKYKMDNGSWTESKTIDGNTSFTTTNATKALFNLGGLGEVYELKVELYHSGNTCPEVNSLTSSFDPQENL